MKKQEIYHAALHLFATEGYNGSLQNVADDVGLTKATLYNYFKSKDQLYLTILENEMNKYLQEIEITVKGNIGTSLEIALFAIVKTFVRESPLDRLLLLKRTQLMIVNSEAHLSIASRKVMLRFNSQLHSVIMDLFLSKGIDITEATIFSNLYYVFVMGILEWILQNAVNKIGINDKTLEDMWKIFWRVCSVIE